jgi:hypothetical protein
LIVLNTIHDIQVTRYTLGVTMATAIAFAMQTPLSYLLPVLTALLLPKMLSRVGLKRERSGDNPGLVYMRDSVFAFAVGYVFTSLLLPFPVLYIPLLGIALFQTYYYLNRGGSFWLVLSLIINLLVLPVLGQYYQGLAIGIAFELVLHSLLTLMVIIVTNLLVPVPACLQQVDDSPVTVFRPGYDPDAAKRASISTIVTLPVALLFVAEVWAGQLPVIIFVATFTLVPAIDRSRVAALGSISATILGGVVAYITYWLLVAVPQYYFAVLVMLALSLLNGRLIFSGYKLAPILPSAMVAIIILINGSLSADSSFTDTFFKRLLLMSLAAVYVVIALRVVNAYWPRRPDVAPAVQPGG